MNHFSKVDQPDEGYSEDPINPSLAGNGPGLHTLSALRSPADLPAWVSRHLSSLSTAVKTRECSLTAGHVEAGRLRSRGPC